MELDEFRLAVTFWVSLDRNNGAPVATLWKRDELEQVQQAPVDASTTTIKVPVVELLRSKGERMKKGFTVATTVAPTSACLGMARMCGIERILYQQGTSLYSIGTSRKGGEAPVLISDAVTTTYPEVALIPAPSLAPKVAVPMMPKSGPVWGKPGTSGGVAAVTGKPVPPAPTVTAVTSATKWYKKPITLPRLKIWVDQQPTKAAIQTAKTMGWGVPADRSKFEDSSLEFLGMKRMVGGDQVAMDNVLMMMAFELIARGSGFKSNLAGTTLADVAQRVKTAEGQRIGSLLADDEGNIVGWGFNTNKENSTRHGEVNLIAQYMETEPHLPAGGTIYTTLEPCEMCSGMIVRAVKHGDAFRVIYGQADANVTRTALQNPPTGRAITMTATQANMVDRSKSVATPAGFASSIAQHQKDVKTIATTAFLKRKDTYEQYMAMGRPAWWMYLWDSMVGQLERQKGPEGLKLTDPAVMRMNADLTVTYELVEKFMNTVQTTALGA
jgi:tRNA(Arg) A34 adenosine deaminase TadA